MTKTKLPPMTGRKRKVYGMRGLLEWRGEMHAYGQSVEVEFTGGTLTGYGVSPARFATDDPVMQRVIEGSAHFKTGRIYLIS